ncbi:30S ribosomal protein S8 [Candidatus Marsarchaeota G2 archaeon BE_D]|jgi:small subunit ribosomal protein S8|uniref:Small ribosomal subunit protein uS8 n=1 Tax=Candidatus Marsarchaeota G2 archaeon BE_D TaxID=1978158 RepID=A0A2R6C5H7_9ARCH|nr:MAG: 30S ribosomal protein S8 [Candidatus Marsarchaeota G2 archaeon BE_D]
MPSKNLLSNLMNTIKLSEQRGKKSCVVEGTSKFIGRVLAVIQKSGYIGEFEFIDDGRGGKLKIQLLGRVNDCGVIVPRVSVRSAQIDQLATRYLPSKDIGVLVISSSKGVMSHLEAREKKAGGVAVAYVY